MQIPQPSPSIRLSDQDIFNLSRIYGYAQTQYHFSKCCGRNRSWLSSLAASNRTMSVDGLTALVLNITRYANEHPDPVTRDRLLEFRKFVVHEVIHRTGEKATISYTKRNQGIFDAHS